MAEMNYKILIETAMLNMVKDILKKISKDGLPKSHHFLITFFSNSKGVIIPDWMKEKYPDKMTIIIRNWFENLDVSERKFEISLNFNNAVERLIIPFNSIELFADPSVDFAISFNQVNSVQRSENENDKEANNQNNASAQGIESEASAYDDVASCSRTFPALRKLPDASGLPTDVSDGEGSSVSCLYGVSDLKGHPKNAPSNGFIPITAAANNVPEDDNGSIYRNWVNSESFQLSNTARGILKECFADNERFSLTQGHPVIALTETQIY